MTISEYQKLITLTKGDINDHPRIVEHAMRKHYLDIRNRLNLWYMIEDKISYSPDFVKWFVKDIQRKLLSQDKKEGGEDESGS